MKKAFITVSGHGYSGMGQFATINTPETPPPPKSDLAFLLRVDPIRHVFLRSPSHFRMYSIAPLQ